MKKRRPILLATLPRVRRMAWRACEGCALGICEGAEEAMRRALARRLMGF